MDVNVTQLISEASAGDSQASEQLYALVYGDLREIARRLLRGQRGAGPQTTSLVHEAYLRLARADGDDFANRAHFFAVAARAMRQILIDHARRRGAVKRGEGDAALDLDAVQVAVEDRSAELLAVDRALASLEAVDERLARVVEWRFFGGMTLEEIGLVLNLSDRTIKRDWRLARAFLARELSLQVG